MHATSLHSIRTANFPPFPRFLLSPFLTPTLSLALSFLAPKIPKTLISLFPKPPISRIYSPSKNRGSRLPIPGTSSFDRRRFDLNVGRPGSGEPIGPAERADPPVAEAPRGVPVGEAAIRVAGRVPSLRRRRWSAAGRRGGGSDRYSDAGEFLLIRTSIECQIA